MKSEYMITKQDRKVQEIVREFAEKQKYQLELDAHLFPYCLNVETSIQTKEIVNYIHWTHYLRGEKKGTSNIQSSGSCGFNEESCKTALKHSKLIVNFLKDMLLLEKKLKKEHKPK